MIGEYVIVRTYNAGVHCGKLAFQNGTQVVLHDATRLYKWYGAFTLHEAAVEGVAESSRISTVVPKILLTQAIEVILCTEKARLSLSSPRNGAP